MSEVYTYISNMDSGSLTSESGHHRFTNTLYSGNMLSGVHLTCTGLDLNLTITQGEFRIPYSDYWYNIYMDADDVETLDAPDISLPNYDLVIAYIDRQMTFTSSDMNNPGACKFKVIKGDVADSPALPTKTAIQNIVGSGNPFIVLGAIEMYANQNYITSDQIIEDYVPVTNSLMAQGAFPVGSIYIETTGTNPATLLGFGTWEAFGAGKTLIGLDTTQTEFQNAEQTGGEATHSLTIDEMPSHSHSGTTDWGGNHQHTYIGQNNAVNRQLWGTADYHYGWTTLMDGANTGGTSWSGAHSHTFTTDSTGSNTGHENRQPYITAYFWKRTA